MREKEREEQGSVKKKKINNAKMVFFKLIITHKKIFVVIRSLISVIKSS